MKIIIAGDGKVGMTLTRQLSAEGHDLTLIDNDLSALESSEERYDIMVVHGNCASMPVLRQAGILEADLLIAATGADEINLLCCMSAHQMNKKLHTIARIRNPEYTSQIYEIRDAFALSLTVNPERQAAEEIEKLYGDNDLVDEKHLARHCIGLSGIGFSDEEIEDLADRIREMKKKDTQICCSIGFLTEKQARILKDAGLDRINHNLNSSRSFYPEICTTHTYDQRVNNIKMLQSLGFEICSGGIVGMGESKEDIVDMLMDIREINPESVPINFLLPIPGTKLADRDISELTPDYCMKVLCLARLMVPKSDIRCAAGREVYFKGLEPELFKVVDSIFASGYLTAGGQGIDDTMKMIKDAGFDGEIESTDH